MGLDLNLERRRTRYFLNCLGELSLLPPESGILEKGKQKFTGPKKPAIVHDDSWGTYYGGYDKAEGKRNAAGKKKALVQRNKDEKALMIQRNLSLS